MPLSQVEDRYLNMLAEREYPTMPTDVEPAGTVRPGAMQGEMSAIPQTKLEAIMEKTGASLEQIGVALDGLGKVNIFGIDIGIRDLLPFVGGSEEEVDPRTGKKTIKQVGTPEALQKAGRGESLVRGTGFATQLVPDAKLAAFDVPAAGALVKSTARMGTAAVKDIAREMATTPPRGSIQIGPTQPQIDVPAKVKGGIRFPEDESANRLRLKVQREQQATQGKAMPGSPKNERIIIEAPSGSELPNFVIGKIEPDDWIQRTESMLSPEEIQQYAKWYDDVRGTFLKYTDNNEELTDKYMRAWLVANQNIGVDGAFNNVLLQAEQFARDVPRAEMRAGGLPFATRAARNALQDEPIVEGVGLKISDFVDSAENKSVRSIYGNDERAGQPFVVDIHTARDTGLVDGILLNHLEKRGYKVNRDAIKTDFMGGPTDTQYENRSDFGRALTARLNEINWQGKNDWQPKEVQAIGWMSMTKLTADAADDTVTALERNLRRISAEARPGEGSPWAARFGERFDALPAEKQAEVSTVVVERAMQMAKDVSGIDLRGVVHGTGGWQTMQSPASVGQALATREGAEIAANTLGYLLQQTEVWVNSVKGMTKNPKAFAVDFIEEASDNLSTDDNLRDFWQRVMSADPTGLFVGYQPIRTADGKVGIRVLIDKGGEKRISDVQSAIQGPISDLVKSMDFKMSVSGYEADLVKARNDWKGVPDGRTYLERLANLGVKRTAADFDPLRGELEDIFEQGLGGSAAAGSAGSAKLKRAAKAKITEGQESLNRGGK